MNTWVIEVKLEDSLNFLIPSFITARSNVTYLLLSKCMKSTCLSHPFKLQFWFTKNQFAPLNLWVQKTFDAKCSQVSSIFLNPKLIAIILTFWNHYFKSQLQTKGDYEHECIRSLQIAWKFPSFNAKIGLN